MLYKFGRVDGDATLGGLFKSQDKQKGITGKAVRLWVHGDGIREKNKIPAHQFEPFVEIVRKRLPGNRTIAEARALILSPNVNDLAEAFRVSVPEIGWMSLVLKAQPGGIVIVLWEPPTDFTITARRRILNELNGSLKCPVNHYFRFKLKSIKPGWITALQWGQSGWFGLELGDDSVSLERSEHEGTFPLNEPYYFESEAGLRRYVFITTPVPLPLDVLSKVKTSTFSVPLDVSTLDRFAYIASEMPGFSINVLDVHFTDHK